MQKSRRERREGVVAGFIILSPVLLPLDTVEKAGAGGGEKAVKEGVCVGGGGGGEGGRRAYEILSGTRAEPQHLSLEAQ